MSARVGYATRSFVCIVALAACGRQGPQPVSADDHVGDAACVACHAEQGTFGQTAHHLTSTAPTRATIRGSFEAGKNVLSTANPDLHYRMEARPDGYYQTAVLESRPDTTISERLGLVIGSGRKGQSYLYWDDDELFQLPVSYWTELDTWVNSPGYRDGVANFRRAVQPRCLECHATYARTVRSGASNQYDTTSVIPGISCETCHGGGREHVARQASRVRSWFGQAIVNPARLSRERQLDLCGLCHGAGEPLAPSFSYLPGEPLEDYVRQRPPPPDQPVDVHGNQVALLRSSPCFQGSAMTCSTCHNVHQTQRSVAAFSATCLSCHQVESCGVFPEQGHQITGNCVDCHMPALPSNTVISGNAGEQLRPRVRTHWIRVYPPAQYDSPIR